MTRAAQPAGPRASAVPSAGDVVRAVPTWLFWLFNAAMAVAVLVWFAELYPRWGTKDPGHLPLGIGRDAISVALLLGWPLGAAALRALAKIGTRTRE